MFGLFSEISRYENKLAQIFTYIEKGKPIFLKLIEIVFKNLFLFLNLAKNSRLLLKEDKNLSQKWRKNRLNFPKKNTNNQIVRKRSLNNYNYKMRP